MALISPPEKEQPSGTVVTLEISPWGAPEVIRSNKYWKERYGHHKRSLSETEMY